MHWKSWTCALMASLCSLTSAQPCAASFILKLDPDPPGIAVREGQPGVFDFAVTHTGKEFGDSPLVITVVFAEQPPCETIQEPSDEAVHNSLVNDKSTVAPAALGGRSGNPPRVDNGDCGYSFADSTGPRMEGMPKGAVTAMHCIDELGLASNTWRRRKRAPRPACWPCPGSSRALRANSPRNQADCGPARRTTMRPSAAASPWRRSATGLARAVASPC
jgi:hypothetical protein